MKALFCLGVSPELETRVRSAFPSLDVAWDDSQPKNLAQQIEGAEILVCSDSLFSKANTEILRAHGKRLRWIQITTSGIDRALANGLPSQVIAANASGIYTTLVAEHAIFLMLAVLRRANEAAAARDHTQWSRAGLLQTIGSLDRATMVVVGLGSVGRDIARKAKAFDMRVIGVSRNSAPAEYFDEIWPRDQLTRAMAVADVVAIATSYEPSVRPLIDETALAAMRSTAILVNVARGALVAEAALIGALETGSIAGAGLDVTDLEPPSSVSPLWRLPNVVMTPHVASGGSDRIGKLFDLIADNMRSYLQGNPLRNVVIAPMKDATESIH